MKNFMYRVERVSGFCASGYKEGDVFYCSGMNTPNVSFCGGAFMSLFPLQVALNSGALFYFEENPKSIGNLSCPDNGCVTFRLTLLEEERG